MGKYVGRFAPSPTGNLHLGSLYTAVASYLDAKYHDGQWLLRIEDIDPPRELIGASDNIIATLQAHGLLWDGDILFQSTRHQVYQDALDYLWEKNLCFSCTCSRQELSIYGDAYPGTCREKKMVANLPSATRLIANPPAMTFTDKLLGKQTPSTLKEHTYNDFVIKRRDELFAYQFAVVVDDIAQGITDIVRGSDILDSTFKQTYLYRYFAHSLPNFLHLPVINNVEGQKLSKQNLAQAIDNQSPCENLLHVLSLLQQEIPPAKLRKNPLNILQWATSHWNINKIPKMPSISYSSTSDIN